MGQQFPSHHRHGEHRSADTRHYAARTYTVHTESKGMKSQIHILTRAVLLILLATSVGFAMACSSFATAVCGTNDTSGDIDCSHWVLPEPGLPEYIHCTSYRWRHIAVNHDICDNNATVGKQSCDPQGNGKIWPQMQEYECIPHSCATQPKGEPVDDTVAGHCWKAELKGPDCPASP